MRKSAKNYACISGDIISTPIRIEDKNGEIYYVSMLEAKRKSGTPDRIPVRIPQAIIIDDFIVGNKAMIRGEVRSNNEDTVLDPVTKKYHSRLVLEIEADEVQVVEGYIQPINYISLESVYICRKPQYRETKSHRNITDLMLAANKKNGNSDYIPSVCWDNRALTAAVLPVGTRLDVTGTFQSRLYTKDEQVREAYEISLYQLDVSEIPQAKAAVQ